MPIATSNTLNNLHVQKQLRKDIPRKSPTIHSNIQIIMKNQTFQVALAFNFKSCSTASKCLNDIILLCMELSEQC